MRTWTVSDVMSPSVVTVDGGTPYRDVVDRLMANGVSAVPVIDSFRRVLGVVSEADLLLNVEFPGSDREPRLFDGPGRRAKLGKARAVTAAELMTSPAITVLSSATVVAAARTMDAEGVKRLPVIDDLGRLVGIVTRSDLLKVHLRPDADIRSEVVDEILRRVLAVEAGAVAVFVDAGTVVLAGRLDRRSAAQIAVRLTRLVAGVVDVVDELEFDFDDTALSAAGVPTGVA